MSDKLLTAQKLTYSVETTHLQSGTKILFLINEKYSKNKEHMYIKTASLQNQRKHNPQEGILVG